jgi:hypothetical protein
MAFSDPSSLSNPRMPLLNELKDLFLAAYQGRGLRRAAEGGQ